MSAEEKPAPKAKPFYQLGGNLPADAPSYVRRAADDDLLKHLLEGRFCYILTSRQMGKSSLMVQTARKLREDHAQVAVLDLTRIGQNLTPEQWYDGLLIPIGREFRLEDELDDFWNSNDAAISKMGPLQRWIAALREVVLPSVKGTVVIFVDEIDAVRGLPFSTDEFFAGIRQLYNERTIDPELERITFCLLGVTKPSDLIRNVNTTPFNVGVRIELTDFTEQEAQPLLAGLARDQEVGQRILRRVLWWTGGHPYLTQRLCAKIAEDPSVETDTDVDRVCEDTFLSPRARERDDNLLFVRERVLRSEVDHASLLDLYSQIRSNKNILDDDSSVLIDTLRLAGLATISGHRLVVRNRIYAHVFDFRWIRLNMPDAELRRQRRAFRKGVAIAAGIAAVVLTIVGFSSYLAYQERQTEQITSYADSIVQVQQEFDSGDYGDGTLRLKQWMVPVEKNHSLGGFEWNWLWSRFSGESATSYYGHWDDVRSVAVSPLPDTLPGGGLIVTGSADSTVRVFDRNIPCTTVTSNNEAGVPVPQSSDAFMPCFQLLYAFLADRSGLIPLHPNSDGANIDKEIQDRLLSEGEKDLLAASPDDSQHRSLPQRFFRWLGFKSGDEGGVRHPQAGSLPSVLAVRFSPDGKWIAMATGFWHSSLVPGNVYLWRVSDGKIVRVPTNHKTAINSVAINNRGDLATAGIDSGAEFFKIMPDGTVSNEELNREYFPGFTGGMTQLVFSQNGRYLAMIFDDGHLAVKDMDVPDDKKSIQTKIVDVSGLASVAFFDDPNAPLILAGSKDGGIWQIDPRDMTLRPHKVIDSDQGLVSSLTVSKDRKILVSSGTDSTVNVWRLQKDEFIEAWDPKTLRGHRAKVDEATITPDNQWIISGGVDASVRFWTHQPLVDTWKTQDPDDSTDSDDAAGTDEEFSYASHPVTLGVQRNPLVQGVVRAVSFSPDGRQLAYIRGVTQHATNGVPDRWAEVFFYDLASKKRPIMIRAHNDVGTAIAYSKFSFIATGANDGSVMLWDSRHIADKGYKPVDITVKTASRDPITKLGFAPDGTLAATLKISILLWSPIKDASRNIIGYNPGKEILRNPKKNRSSLSLSQDGRWYAVCTSESVNNDVVRNTVEILDAANPETKPLRVLTGAEEGTSSPNEDGAMRGACLSAVFSSNSKWLAAGTNSREIVVWNIEDGWKRVTGDAYQVAQGGKIVSKPLTAPPPTSANINAVRFSADNKLLAYATSDAKIYLWDLADKRPGPVVDVHTGGVWAIAFSPNGNCLASGSTDGTLRITPTATTTLVAQNWIPFGSWWNPCFDPKASK